MRLVFCGTPEFAVPCLEAVVGAGHTVELVLAQPDRPQGRGMRLTAPPVKVAAERLGIAIEQPMKIKNNQELQAQLGAIAPDAIVVVAYGRILPPWMLALPKHGCINVHASLLPKYRGAAPIQWALAKGERVTGVTTMQMDEGLDTGDVLRKSDVVIAPDWRAPELSAALSRAGAGLLVETLAAIARGEARAEKQDDSQATLAPLLSKADGEIDWRRSAAEIVNRWRGFFPWPGAYTTFAGETLQVKEMRLAAEFAERGKPGEQRNVGVRWFVCAGDGGWVELLTVQVAGRKAVSAAEFLRGRGFHADERLG